MDEYGPPGPYEVIGLVTVVLINYVLPFFCFYISLDTLKKNNRDHIFGWYFFI